MRKQSSPRPCWACPEMRAVQETWFRLDISSNRDRARARSPHLAYMLMRWLVRKSRWCCGYRPRLAEFWESRRRRWKPMPWWRELRRAHEWKRAAKVWTSIVGPPSGAAAAESESRDKASSRQPFAARDLTCSWSRNAWRDLQNHLKDENFGSIFTGKSPERGRYGWANAYGTHLGHKLLGSQFGCYSNATGHLTWTRANARGVD